MFGRGVASEALTDLLGIDGEELRRSCVTVRRSPRSPQNQDVAVQDVIDELVAKVTERVDNAVENDRIDQTEADQKLANAKARITNMVNNGRPSAARLTDKR